MASALEETAEKSFCGFTWRLGCAFDFALDRVRGLGFLLVVLERDREEGTAVGVSSITGFEPTEGSLKLIGDSVETRTLGVEALSTAFSEGVAIELRLSALPLRFFISDFGATPLWVLLESEGFNGIMDISKC